MKSLKQILLLLTWYDYRIHRGVAQVAREAGWHLICPKCDYDLDRILEGWKGDGCITLVTDSKLLDHFHSLNVAIVDLGLSQPECAVTHVATDNMEIGRLAAEYFIGHGYQEIFAASPGDGRFHIERLAALTHHVESNGGRVTVVPGRKGNWANTFDQFQRIATERGTRLEELSIAFFAYDDYSAAELISLCLEKGLRVPENVAILGVDNDDLINEGLAISLSSIDSDQEGLGREGALLLRDMFDHPDSDWQVGRIIRHPPKGIITRKSTDCYAVRSPLVAKALHWIQNNYQNAIRAVDVALAMEVTQQGLQKAFSANHLRSPGEEIRHQRVEAAKYHLIHSTANLETIAELCGYTSIDTLITSFRKAFGTTPGKFRKRNRRHGNRGEVKP